MSNQPQAPAPHWLFTSLSKILDSSKQPVRELTFQLFIFHQGKLLLVRPENRSFYTVLSKVVAKDLLRTSSFSLTTQHILRHAIEERTFQNFHFPAIVKDVPILEHEGPTTRWSVLLFVGSSAELPPTTTLNNYGERYQEYKWATPQDCRSLPIIKHLLEPRPGNPPLCTLQKAAQHYEATILTAAQIRSFPSRTSDIPRTSDFLRMVGEICRRAVVTQSETRSIEQDEQIEFVLVAFNSAQKDTIWLLQADENDFSKVRTEGHQLIRNSVPKGGHKGGFLVEEFVVVGLYQRHRGLQMAEAPSLNIFREDGLLEVEWIQQTKMTVTAGMAEGMVRRDSGVGGVQRDSADESAERYPMPTQDGPRRH